MSRVDEALRRAAEAAKNGGDRTETEQVAGTLASAEAGRAEISPDSFPIEMPERRPRRTTPLSTSPVTKTRVAPPIEAAETGGSPAESSLFKRFGTHLAGKVVVDQAMSPASREQYRRLAAALHHTQETNGCKVVLIASAAVGEGKTLTASNLALTLSESYHRDVLLVDADLRRPSLHTVFGTTGAPGLSEGLRAAADQKIALRDISPRLTLLPAGAPNSDPMAVLTSARMRQLLDEARQSFDWVIIDTPPVGLLTDASLLAAMVDGAILVISAGSTHHELVRRAVDSIGQSRLLGVVLNRASTQDHGYGAAYDYYGHYHQAPTTADVAQ
jgi:capsular exopolysaccharide synthesis family protein